MNIQKVNVQDVWNLRHNVMWPEKPFDYIKIDGDEQAEHWGVLENGEVVSVLSLFPDEEGVQFRKFCTKKDCQNKGYGSRLLNAVLEMEKERGVRTIWCNARVEKTDFYLKFGMEPTNRTFEKGGRQYVILKRRLND